MSPYYLDLYVAFVGALSLTWLLFCVLFETDRTVDSFRSGTGVFSLALWLSAQTLLGAGAYIVWRIGSELPF